MWKRILYITLLIFIAVGLFVHDADARRFGGGRSFGFSRSASSFSRPSSPSATPIGRQGQSAIPGSRWAGPVLGLLAGGLIASLLMQNGLMSGMITWLVFAAVLMMLYQFIKSRMQPQPAYKEYSAERAYAQAAAADFMRNATSSSQAVAFNEAEFVRDAKVLFLRMQAAYDHKNLTDIREFTTPEVFAEIQVQIQERGEQANATHVISLEAECLGTEMNNQVPVASVRFTGRIQEERNQAAEPFNEIWHFKQQGSGARWLIAGVQQN